ncbi:N-acyl-D-glutamate deacylase [bioreactor metagenome]|uniref:N-acyl-D-glutamate deacylase n=1 Tax=bioreactor metagenome TaxID=1076179 RepID=A0A644ZB05_9ZZZZ
MIHNAKIPVMHDVYPYAASSTLIRSTLPPNVQKMDQDDIITYLKDVNNHEQLKKSIFNPDKNFESPLASCGYDGILIFDAAHTKDAIGKTIEQYADYLGIQPFDAFIKILTENSLGAGYIGFSMSEDDVETLVADSLCMFGTDGLYVPGMPMTHPRAIGTFPRILGRYVREKHVLTLEEAIRKMTSLPAKFYGLENKGEINVGMDADIVLFDAERIIDHSDYQQPLLQNEGIHFVIVNGKIAVEYDKYLGIKNGALLKARQSKDLSENFTFSTKMSSFINMG